MSEKELIDKILLWLTQKTNMNLIDLATRCYCIEQNLKSFQERVEKHLPALDYDLNAGIRVREALDKVDKLEKRFDNDDGVSKKLFDFAVGEHLSRIKTLEGTMLNLLTVLRDGFHYDFDTLGELNSNRWDTRNKLMTLLTSLEPEPPSIKFKNFMSLLDCLFDKEQLKTISDTWKCSKEV